MRLENYFYILFLTLLICSCKQNSSIQEEVVSNLPDSLQHLDNLNVFPDDIEPTHDINIELEAIVGQSEDKRIDPLYNGNIAVDDQGRIFSGGYYSIEVFNPDGSHSTTLGREGSGPGEFRTSIVQPKIIGDSIVVLDAGLQLATIYSLDTLDFSRSISLNPDTWSHVDGLTNPRANYYDTYVSGTDSFLVGFMGAVDFNLIEDAQGRGQAVSLTESEINYLAIDLEGNVSDDIIFEKPWMRMIASYDDGTANFYPYDPPVYGFGFIRNSLMAVSPIDGRIFSAWSDNMLIQVFDEEGNYMRSFYHPSYDKVPLMVEDIRGATGEPRNPATFERITRPIEVPDTWPALYSMLVDDENRLWVATITEDEEFYEWWVMDEYGELLAKFEWPGFRWWPNPVTGGIKFIKDGYLYAHYGFEGRYEGIERSDDYRFAYDDSERELPEDDVLVKYRVDFLEKD